MPKPKPRLLVVTDQIVLSRLFGTTGQTAARLGEALLGARGSQAGQPRETGCDTAVESQQRLKPVFGL